MKIPSLICFVVLWAATRLIGASEGRERIRFDDGWKFHLHDGSVGDDPAPLIVGKPIASWRWRSASGSAAETAEVVLANFDDQDWVVIQSGRNLIRKANSAVWFRAVLPGAKGDQPRLHFEGVDDVATVYLNGKRMGEHTGWEEPFDISLASAWDRHGKNVVVVLVQNLGGSGGMDTVSFQSEEDRQTVTAEAGPAVVHYDDHGWRDIHLPHDFVVEGTFDAKAEASHGFLPKGAGWYRNTFTLPAEDKGKVIWLEFDGVYRNSIVWLNGRELGKHASGYTSFFYDVSGEARYGDENVLTVWADARRNEGWWYEGGGIYRHVYLTKLPPLHVAHWGTQIVATPSENLKKSQVEVWVDVANDSPKTDYQLEQELVGPDGMTLSTQRSADSLRLAARQQKRVGSWFEVNDPQLWSPDSPRLYTLRTKLRQSGKVVDAVETTFGIRSLRWDRDQGFFLNGKPFKIQGTCNHQDFAGLGVALPDRVHYYKVEKLKEMGSNAFRYSHQPMAPELLDACDRLGMVVMDENRKLGDSTEILEQVESLVRRDRNHPSVVMWSMCNEESLQGTPRGGEMFGKMKEVVLKWDRSRQITAAMNGGYGGGISLVNDLQGFNYHPQAYDGFHAKFPGLPCYGSETASETTTRGVYQDDKAKGYATSHKTTAEEAWKPIAERPWMAGGFVWTGFDYRGEPTPYQWPCVNSHFGIMDTCGFPKDSYYYYQAEWGGKPAVHLSAQWNLQGNEGQETAVWVTSNTAKCELFLNGESLGVKDCPPHQHSEWKVKWAPGTLEARGLDREGKVVVTDKIETTGAPASLELTPDRTTFTADHEDVILVRCAVLDAQGRVVPTANDEIAFDVKGSAHVAGVGNGDPSDHDPDKASKRHAFGGHCLAIVQAEGKSGEVTFNASAPGLRGASLTLQARP